MSERVSFTFIVLTYNHVQFIIEHLESIKFQIENYGDNITTDIIIADDGSRDKTTELAGKWFEQYTKHFNKISILSDGINRGTCLNLKRALEITTTKFSKITAGDDIYSFENIFFDICQSNYWHILSGLPLNLIDGKLNKSNFDLFNIIATNIIYRNDSHLKRLQRINFFNSPSIYYDAGALSNIEVLNFLAKYSVTEDYPLQIKIAEIFEPIQYIQVQTIYIYYRRTSNSTYIIKNTAFSKDKVQIFNYLIDRETSFFGKYLLKNRLFCFLLENKYLKRLLNLNLYLYALRVLWHVGEIFPTFNNLNVNYQKHQNHYNEIFKGANKFLSKYHSNI